MPADTFTLEEIIKNIRKYNSKTPCQELYGFPKDAVYDALVIAPGWKPDRIISDTDFIPITTALHAYVSAYEVQYNELKIAWVQCASGAPNLVDHLVLCKEIRFKALFFIGAVGALTENHAIGEFCTPSECIAVHLGPEAYFNKKLFGSSVMPLPVIEQPKERIREIEEALTSICPDKTLKTARTFCTDSIALEYSHLNEIRRTGAELIDMETATFLRVAPMFEVPYYILLDVSDNSATKKALIGADVHKERADYLECRGELIPRIIVELTRKART